MVMPKNRRDRAFTLVELLVVVSIIALLVAILLPSLQGARNNAKKTKCAVNVRSIVQAGLTYAADDRLEWGIPQGVGDATYPESYRAPYGFGGKSGTGATGNANSGSYFSGRSPKYQGSVHRPLNRIMYPKATFYNSKGSFENWEPDTKTKLPIFQCPGDKGFPGMHIKGWAKRSSVSSYDYFGTSYIANVYLVSSAGAGQPVDSNSPYYRSLSRVPNPGNTILYMENAARYAPYAENSELDQTNGWWPYTYAQFTANGWHKQTWRFNVGFCDGSARNIKLKGHGNVQFGPGTIESQNRTILIRGLDWQIDTLPGALLKTNKIRSQDINGHTPQDGEQGEEFQVVDRPI
ncbi:MAG: type II secretion system protein [Phycisphaerae bacterium]|nr:type II secretion system protein [Phycisphaerales bacterium]